MNTYEENLKSTAIATLSALAARLEKLGSAQTAEHFKLYYAQGAQLTALDEARRARDLLEASAAIDSVCLADCNAAASLLATATTGEAIVATGNADMAAAASHVQIASNAITRLAAEMGAALNNATASLFGSNVCNRIEDAYKLINEVASDARKISEASTTASINTSEIIATAVLTQASGFKAKLEGLLEATQAEHGKYENLFLAGRAAVEAAGSAGRQAEGAVLHADCAVQAAATASARANRELNVRLVATLVSADITAPRPHCRLSIHFQELHTPAFTAPPASDVAIPGIVAPDDPGQPAAAEDPAPFHYVVLLAPESRKGSVTTDLVQELFAAPAERTGRFVGIKPSDSPQVLRFDQDVYLDAIEPGQPYVVFLFVVLSKEYKFFTNNYADWLSAPSPCFTVADTLPMAVDIRAQALPGNQDKPLSVCFEAAPKELIEGATLEYRCILVEEDDTAFALQLMRTGPSPIFFDLDIASRVAPANYERIEATPPATPPGMAARRYIIDFKAWSTDNFGRPLRPGATYRPYILAVVSGPDTAAYVSTLAYGDPIQLPVI